MKLIVIDGPMQGQEFFLKKTPITIGRKQEADICLSSDTSIALVHCRIMLENDQYYIEDLGGTSGTWVNDKPVTARTVLPPRTIFRIGQTFLGLLHDQDKQSITIKRPAIGGRHDIRHAPEQHKASPGKPQ